MKLREAMQKVWENDMEWFTRSNALQWLAALGIFCVLFWPWIPLGLTYNTVMKNGPLFVLWLVLCIPAALWSFFWVRVFSRWWPF